MPNVRGAADEDSDEEDVPQQVVVRGGRGAGGRGAFERVQIFVR
jgi:hypothetical protein